MFIHSSTDMTSEDFEFCFISLEFKSTYATPILGGWWKQNEIWQVRQMLQCLHDF